MTRAPAPRGLFTGLRNVVVPSALLWAGIIWGASRLIGGMS